MEGTDTTLARVLHLSISVSLLIRHQGENQFHEITPVCDTRTTWKLEIVLLYFKTLKAQWDLRLQRGSEGPPVATY